jgi:hypothetical protein
VNIVLYSILLVAASIASVTVAVFFKPEDRISQHKHFVPKGNRRASVKVCA